MAYLLCYMLHSAMLISVLLLTKWTEVFVAYLLCYILHSAMLISVM